MFQSQSRVPLTTLSFIKPRFTCKAITTTAKTSHLHRFCRTTHSPTTLAPPTPNNKFSSLSSPSRSQATNIASRRTDLVSRHVSSGPRSTTASMSYGKQPSEFSVRKIGAPNTLEFRAFIERDGQPMSPFHDVPLYANEQQTVLNMIVEIPRWTNAKLEVGFPRSQFSWFQWHSPKPWVVARKSKADSMIDPDLQRRIPQPYQARYQEGQASLRPQLLPSQRLPLELRCLPSRK